MGGWIKRATPRKSQQPSRNSATQHALKDYRGDWRVGAVAPIFRRSPRPPRPVKRFIESPARVLSEKTPFTGIDYDWEHPATPTEADNYNALIVETREAFFTARASPSVPAHCPLDEALQRGGGRPGGYPFLMAYDGGRRHSTLAYAEKGDSPAAAARRGPAEKTLPRPALLWPQDGRHRSGRKPMPALSSALRPNRRRMRRAVIISTAPKTIAAKVDLARKTPPRRRDDSGRFPQDTPDQSALLRVIADKRKAAHETQHDRIRP